VFDPAAAFQQVVAAAAFKNQGTLLVEAQTIVMQVQDALTCVVIGGA